jgi:predicted RNA-binding protein YlxR (DUF448 family)
LFHCRQWQLRRVIFTKKGISFALTDHDEEIDFIPLEEVASIDEMGDTEDSEADQILVGNIARKLKPKLMSGRNRFSNSSASSFTDIEMNEDNKSATRLFVNAFQIATVPDGYNSGRSYYLQADSSQVKQELISQLQELAKSARKKVHETTWLLKLQGRVRTAYVHKSFQSTAALLIIAVRCPHVFCTFDPSFTLRLSLSLMMPLMLCLSHSSTIALIGKHRGPPPHRDLLSSSRSLLLEGNLVLSSRFSNGL